MLNYCIASQKFNVTGVGNTIAMRESGRCVAITEIYELS